MSCASGCRAARFPCCFNLLGSNRSLLPLPISIPKNRVSFMGSQNKWIKRIVSRVITQSSSMPWPSQMPGEAGLPVLEGACWFTCFNGGSKRKEMHWWIYCIYSLKATERGIPTEAQRGRFQARREILFEWMLAQSHTVPNGWKQECSTATPTEVHLAECMCVCQEVANVV